MIFSDAEITALQADTQNIGIFFRLDTDPVVRLWLGFGDIEPGVNVLDETGATYKGFGEINEMPAFAQLINGAAERVEFVLNGVSGDLLSVAAGEADAVKGKNVAIGLAVLDSSWAMLGAIHWTAFYTADYIGLQQNLNTDPAQTIIRTITLSCGSRFTARRRPGLSYFTAVDQQARFPGDTFCDLASQYAHNFQILWPTY